MKPGLGVRCAKVCRLTYLESNANGEYRTTDDHTHTTSYGVSDGGGSEGTENSSNTEDRDDDRLLGGRD